jgi:hypothetical protein
MTAVLAALGSDKQMRAERGKLNRVCRGARNVELHQIQKG